jgi:hypothetical protein
MLFHYCHLGCRDHSHFWPEASGSIRSCCTLQECGSVLNHNMLKILSPFSFNLAFQFKPCPKANSMFFELLLFANKMNFWFNRCDYFSVSPLQKMLLLLADFNDSFTTLAFNCVPIRLILKLTSYSSEYEQWSFQLGTLLYSLGTLFSYLLYKLINFLLLVVAAFHRYWYWGNRS